jgi:hypothetical protein
MPDYQNPAGRLLKIFAELGSAPMNIEAFAAKLGTPNEWGSIFNGLAGMRKEYELLETAVSDFKDNPHKLAQYKDDLGLIKKTLNAMTLSVANGNVQFTPDAAAITALKYMAIDLPQEELVAPDEIEDIRRLCAELQKEIETSQTLNKTLKEWLLDLVRMMRDGIDRFKIRGSRGFRKELYQMLGSMLVHYEDVKEVAKKEPGIWTKMMQGVDRVCRASERFEKVGKALTVAYKAISYFSGDDSNPLQLPGP